MLSGSSFGLYKCLIYIIGDSFKKKKYIYNRGLHEQLFYRGIVRHSELFYISVQKELFYICLG